MLPSMLFTAHVRDTSSAQDEELRRQVSTQSATTSIQLKGNIGDPVLVRTAHHTDKLQPKWTPGFYIIGKRCNSYRISDGVTEKTAHASNVRVAEDAANFQRGELDGHNIPV